MWPVVVLWQTEELKEPAVVQVGEFQPIPSKMLPSSVLGPLPRKVTPQSETGLYICSCTRGLGLWIVR